MQLLGFCEERGERILVFEFMPHGALHDHLHGGATDGSPLFASWEARLRVALDAARGVEYLHCYAVPPIIHRDVKPSNILLDGDWTAKVSDFGLSLASGGAAAAAVASSSTTAGTVGYIDPEYYRLQELTERSDVYSFGVVLLELITAMKVVDFDRPAAEVNLASLALDRIGKGRVGEIVDPAILGGGEEWVMESVRHVSELAFRCLAFHKDVRPAMCEVAAELHRIRDAAPDSDSDSGSGLRPMMDVQIDLSLDGAETVGKKVAVSPVSVQEVWVSDQSSPSTNGSMPRFVA